MKNNKSNVSFIYFHWYWFKKTVNQIVLVLWPKSQLAKKIKNKYHREWKITGLEK